ncbi:MULTISPECIES: radical SAM family heme chaperone HemW [Prochlorococcus]|uniref:radical SAM family heme chaperone HemW n=1 Tax=Prochlorococcus TaxID=1218 RepID=UPI0005338621|nr:MULTISPECIES: radical SAM family heme chaperone HemW [Prochlorococcus]KGG11973.1 Oxygen independent coproporphyrinogen III oxidase [Prochlorococcus sp. MIT 0601]
MHIPFCHRRCFYCDFPIVPLGDFADGEFGSGSASVKAYLELLFREVALIPKAYPLSTVYIGGGTPSILSPKQISALLGRLERHFGFQDGAEITLEIDPASFNKQKLQEYLGVGINRVSLGAQSFDNEVLASLGRRHDSNQLLDSCEWISAFFEQGEMYSWSLDLIQNLPGHNLAFWEKQLEMILEICPPHLSIYDLSIEKGTVFAWRKLRGELNLPNDDLAADVAQLTSSKLKNAGYARYEISNYALPGHASRHNRVYWSGAGWWGVGLGAASCPWGKRLHRPKKRSEYEAWLLTQETYGLDKSLQHLYQQPIDLDELFIVGLRRREGIDFEELAEDWGWNPIQRKAFLEELEKYWKDSLKRGWIQRKGSRFALHDPEGMDVSNHVLVEMLLWWDSLPKDAVALPIA